VDGAATTCPARTDDGQERFKATVPKGHGHGKLAAPNGERTEARSRERARLESCRSRHVPLIGGASTRGSERRAGGWGGPPKLRRTTFASDLRRCRHRQHRLCGSLPTENGRQVKHKFATRVGIPGLSTIRSFQWLAGRCPSPAPPTAASVRPPPGSHPAHSRSPAPAES
jgi:hypothetical protein